MNMHVYVKVHHHVLLFPPSEGGYGD